MKRAIQSLLLVLVLLLPACALAQEAGTLLVTMRHNNAPISGARLALIQVGRATTVHGLLCFEPIQPFTAYGISFEGLTERQSIQLAKNLNQIVVKEHVRGNEAITNQNGAAYWAGLQRGVYLVRQTGSQGTAVHYKDVEPFMVLLPIMNEAGTAWVESIQAFPKSEPIPTPSPTPKPEEKLLNLRVVKRWEDASNAEDIRPVSITLYLDQKLKTDADYPAEPLLTVQMQGKGAKWSFTFHDLPRRNANREEFVYRVREAAVEGYLTTYEDEGRIITNVHATVTPDPNSTPTPVPTITPQPSASPTPQPKIPAGVKEIDGVWYYIDEYGVPLGVVPQTGDDSNLLFYGMAALLLMGAAAMLGILLLRKRKQS
ncbi:MAG: Cna B-type domain-containing protein [Clostridia bacterium]